MKEELRIVIFIETEHGARQVLIPKTLRSTIIDLIANEENKVQVIDVEVPFEFE